MAQKTGNEETEFKSVPETLTLCINNCGVTGNPATNNMCQNCFNTVKFTRSIKSPARNSTEIRRKVEVSDQKTIVATVKREVNRCSGCKKKVGLTGFRCRCGDMFCSDHRYSDRHDCSFDYKAVGRQMIARENPVVKAAKIIRI